MKEKQKKVTMALSLCLAVVLVLGFVPLVSTPVTGENNGGCENIAFVPNSGEASVSRVDLDNQEEIARYYTAPREDPDPYDWRTNRIALDSEGNAWVLNTGADGSNLQGSIVRIQRDTEGLTTNEDPENPLPFGDDEAVQVFDVGEEGDIPRAIAIDDDGYIWVGFYEGGQLSQYEYDDGELYEVGGPWYPEDLHIGYYNMEFSPDRTLFISSRDSEPDVDPDTGIYSFDGEEFERETEFNPYFLLISDDGDIYIYASSYTGGFIWDRQEDEEIDVTFDDDYTEAHRGMAFDDNGRIWIASTDEHSGGDRVYWLDLDTEETGFITIDTDYGTTPIGLGRDAQGNMWVVLRSDGEDEGWIQAFDPETEEFVGAVEVGNRPYAYAGIVVDEWRPCEDTTDVVVTVDYDEPSIDICNVEHFVADCKDDIVIEDVLVESLHHEPVTVVLEIWSDDYEEGQQGDAVRYMESDEIVVDEGDYDEEGEYWFDYTFELDGEPFWVEGDWTLKGTVTGCEDFGDEEGFDEHEKEGKFEVEKCCVLDATGELDGEGKPGEWVNMTGDIKELCANYAWELSAEDFDLDLDNENAETLTGEVTYWCDDEGEWIESLTGYPMCDENDPFEFKVSVYIPVGTPPGTFSGTATHTLDQIDPMDLLMPGEMIPVRHYEEDPCQDQYDELEAIDLEDPFTLTVYAPELAGEKSHDYAVTTFWGEFGEAPSNRASGPAVPLDFDDDGFASVTIGSPGVDADVNAWWDATTINNIEGPEGSEAVSVSTE